MVNINRYNSHKQSSLGSSLAFKSIKNLETRKFENCFCKLLMIPRLCWFSLHNCKRESSDFCEQGRVTCLVCSWGSIYLLLLLCSFLPHTFGNSTLIFFWDLLPHEVPVHQTHLKLLVLETESFARLFDHLCFPYSQVSFCVCFFI